MVRERLSNLHNPLKLQCTVVECIALSSTTTAEMKTPRFCPTKMEVIWKELHICGWVLKVKIDSFEKKKNFEISTENFEKILGAGIWFFWSQTSRNWPNINLKSKNLE